MPARQRWSAALLWLAEEEVEGCGDGAFLLDLEACFLKACGPPGFGAGASVAEGGAEDEFNPAIVVDQHEEELASGLEDACGFGEGLLRSFAGEVIHGVGADDGIESGVVEGELAHVGGGDVDSLVEAGGFEVGEKPLLRGGSGAEVVLERVAEFIECGEGGLWARIEDHDGGAAGACSDVEDFTLAGFEEVSGGERASAGDVYSAQDEERGGGPEGDDAEGDKGPSWPFAEPGGSECGEGGDEDDDVAVAEPPGVTEIECRVGVHVSTLVVRG